MNLKHFEQYTWLPIAAGAALAGWLANRVGIPAAWFVAPMLLALLVALTGRERITIPPLVYLGSQAVIGVAASATFKPATVEALAHHWLPVLAVVSIVILLSLTSGAVLSRTSGMHAATALLGALPGGAPAMVATSDDMDADGRLVAFMQYMRLLVVIFSTTLLTQQIIGSTAAESIQPATSTHENWLAYTITTIITIGGGWLGVRWGIPAGAMVVPALLGAIAGALGIAHGALPAGVVPASSLILGVQVGLRFNRDALRQVGELAAPMLLGTMFLVGGAALLGWLLALFTDLDLLTAYLAAIPGGIQAVTIIALDSGANSTFVLTVHLMRFLVIVLVGPHLVRWLVHALATTAPLQTPETAAEPDPSTTLPPTETRKNRC